MLGKERGYIQIDKVNIYYEFIDKHLLLESRPLLIFLHEGLGSIAQWKDFPAMLCEKIKCPALLYDREGHGKSDELKNVRYNEFMHIQAQKVLPELFKQLEIEQYNKILIGHSDGGSIAIIHAGSFHENIIGIITEASHQFIEDISVQGIREAVKQFEKGKLKDLLYKYHGEKTSSMFYGWATIWLQPEFRIWNIEEYVKKINIPFLAVQGTEDQYGSFAQLESIKKHFLKSDINHILNCGHIPHLQAKDFVLNLMADFINKLC
jgi:pimeloyl-ACP methyl ester carboxylesterase